jgi:uncharacterized protein (TIGR02145 family)
MMKLQNKVFSLLAVLLLCLVACSESGDATSEIDDPSKDTEKQEPEQVPVYSIRAWSEIPYSGQTATVHILELDSLLNETGREFNMDKSKGGFSSDSIRLKGEYALLRAEDFMEPYIAVNYAPIKSDKKLSFEILVNLSDTTKAYISLAGHFVTGRARFLVLQGVAPDSAVRQANAELLKVFAFDTEPVWHESLLNCSSNSDAYYATDVIWDAFKPFVLAGMYDDMKALFETQFFAEGSFVNYDVFTFAADNLAAISQRNYESGSKRYYGEGESMLRIVADEVFARQFYTKVYGLGACGKENLCELELLKDSLSEYNGSEFVCDSLGWLLSSNLLRNTCSYGPAKDYEMRRGALDTTEWFYYNDFWGKWQECDEIESVIGMCYEEREGEYGAINDSAFYYCGNRLWQDVPRDEYYANIIKCDSSEKYVAFASDSATPFYCEYGTLRSMTDAERALYNNTNGLKCDTVPDLVLGNDSATWYVCDAGHFREAYDLELSAKQGCTGNNYDEIRKIDYSYYRCRGRWKYINDTLYRDTVTDARDGQKYPLIGMGSQLWFAANLNYETDSSWCYNDSTANCDMYGHLYRLAEAAAVKDDSLLCPKGFHVPDSDEFETFTDFIVQWRPSNESLSPLLKSRSSGGKDYFGFNALLVGARDDAAYHASGSVSYFCSRGLPTAKSVRRWRIAEDLSFTYESVAVSKTCFVRCVAD